MKVFPVLKLVGLNPLTQKIICGIIFD
jgi:hypothetical protein